MDVEKVIAKLEKEYPGKNIVVNGKGIAGEIVCEANPAKRPGEKGVAIAVIDRSVPHYHKKITEIYRVINGGLLLYIDNEPHQLKPGDEYAVIPGQVHCAIGNETWVEVVANPGWTPDDHFLV